MSMRDRLQTQPSTFDMASPEIVPIQFDFSPQLLTSETIQEARCSIRRVDGELIEQLDHLVGGPTIDGSTVTQVVRGIEATRLYRLRCTVECSTSFTRSLFTTLIGVRTA